MYIEYIEKFNLRINDFDCHDNILMSSILDLFQDVAGKHATKLGIGFDDLLVKNRLWAIIRTKFKILRQPKLEETIIVKTWPLPLGKVDGDRCYQILSETGEVLINGISKWVNIDINNRRLVRLNEVSYGNGDFLEGNGEEKEFTKIALFTTEGEKTKVVPSYLDIDHNGHINNTKYADYILNNIKELHDKEILECQMEYIQELKKGQEFYLSYLKIENEFLIKGESEKGIHFIAKVLIK